MKIKCSVTLDEDIVKQIEEVATAQKRSGATFSSLVNAALAERFLADMKRSDDLKRQP